MNSVELQKAWSIPAPWSLEPVTQGENNLTHKVVTPDGAFMLRTYSSDRPPERIRHELLTLNTLQQQNLPFQIPAPLPTVTGDLFAVSSGTIVTMTPWLSGSQARNDDPQHTFAAGQALAYLVTALREVQVQESPCSAPFPPSGEFEGWAGTHIDPADRFRDLPLADNKKERTLRLLEGARASVPSLYRLPQQIIHRDYDQSNILMLGSTVTAVLDFEFCGSDLRALDLAYALSKWPSGLWNTGQEWQVLEAFGRGYMQHQMLTLNELDSLPDILRLRAATSLYFRLGRFARGLETPESLLEKIEETLSDEMWLETNKEKLLHLVHNWLN
jgi:homoserine kinase type II